jgi:4'-phosphopantetheinyl transferase
MQAVEGLGERDVHVWVVPLDDPDKKRRRELAHHAQSRLLGSYLGLPPAAVTTERGSGGKPRLPDGQLEFNLSHSERVALLAVTRRMPVGVDVQAPHPTASMPWFAKRICTPREYEHYLADPRPEELLRLWARKEAVIKARGEGSYVAVGEIDVLDDDLGEGWFCQDIELPAAPGYHAAVVARGEPDAQITLRRFAWT